MTRLPRLLLVLSLMSGVIPAAGQDVTFRMPRTVDGRPDLHGVWNFSSGVPLQRPAAFAGRRLFTKKEFDSRRLKLFDALAAAARLTPVESVGREWIDTTLYVDDLRTSLITYPDNGRLPALIDGIRRVPGADDILALLADGGNPSSEFTDFAAAFGGGRKDGYTDFNASERCLGTESPPLVPHFGENFVQIIQAHDFIALVSDSERRIVALGTNLGTRSAPRNVLGTSIGRWEADTLVVETRNFDAHTPSFAGAGNALGKVVTERFTRTSANGIQYSATIVDPRTFTDRIELSFPMARVDVRLFENACHEGNYSLANTLSAVRKADAERRETH